MTDNRFTFTRAKLQDLNPPKKGRMHYHDGAMRGLVLCVTETGSKSFLIYRKLNGRPLKRKLGMFDPDVPESRELPEGAKPRDLYGHNASLNIRQARKLAQAVNASLDEGKDPAAEKQTRGSVTLGELFTHYRQHLIGERKKSVESLTWAFERYLGELPQTPRKKFAQERTKARGAVNWQRRPVSNITPADVAHLRLSLAENVGTTTANRVVELLRAAYNFAKKAKPPLYSGENPAAGITKFDEHSRERFVQAHESASFATALDSEADKSFQDYVLLSVLAGSRRKNLLRMRWEELSLDGAEWTLSGEKMKNGDPLVIPLVPKAVEVLRRRAKTSESEWVFPGGTPAGHMGPPRKKWAKFLKRADIANLHIHDLRRTLGSWMTTTGANTVTTMAALGHRSIDAALIYQRLERAPIRDAMKRGSDAFFQAARASTAKKTGNYREPAHKVRRAK